MNDHYEFDWNYGIFKFDTDYQIKIYKIYGKFSRNQLIYEIDNYLYPDLRNIVMEYVTDKFDMIMKIKRNMYFRDNYNKSYSFNIGKVNVNISPKISVIGIINYKFEFIGSEYSEIFKLRSQKQKILDHFKKTSFSREIECILYMFYGLKLNKFNKKMKIEYSL